jgi:hypothetical protein
MARRKTLAKAATAVLGLVLIGSDQAAGQALQGLEYNRDIRPILSESCFACHGADKTSRKAGLRLDVREEALDAGVIVPGDPEKSPFIERICAQDPKKQMPPVKAAHQLTETQKSLLKRWIAAGATYQPHWSFIPPQRPRPPLVKNAGWVRNAIDAFVLDRLEKQGLQPAPEADRPTLARRVSLDLTGLPPTPAEVEAFVADEAPDAYERFVDQLLQSPHWGEHRARYWLDAARYADTHGIHFDNYREIWTYRDWVIEAFNRNLSFDQFTVAQFAGDLLPGHTLDQLIASGFNRCNITTNEGGVIPEEYLVLYTRDRTETVARIWMGLTANCAVCHDHKFDPLSQREFYSLAAFFNNTTQGAMDGNIKDTPPILTLPRPEDRPRWQALPGELAKLDRELQARGQAARRYSDAWGCLPAAPMDQLARMVCTAWQAGRPAKERSAAQTEKWLDWWLGALDRSSRAFLNKRRDLQVEEKAARSRGTVAYIMQERAGAPSAYVLYRGEYDKRRDAVQPGTPKSLPPWPAEYPKNRLGLARWLVRPEQPLTARVTVNRAWQEIFGTGLVRTSDDFGIMGEAPSHPDLLDWLAVEFCASGWDVKRLYKLLVTSAAYRQAAVTTSEKLEKDPQNRLLSRGPRFRMDAEMIRDTALAAGGLLVRNIGGPSVKPYQPAGVWEAVAMIGSNTRTYRQDHGMSLYRRSLYTFWKRSAPPASLEIFNAPSRETCSVRRERTDTPLQALVTLNDPQLVEAARALAEATLRSSGKSAEARIAFVARRLLARPLRTEEQAVVVQSLRRLLDYYQTHVDDAHKLLRVGESPADPSLDPALHAAWTMLVNELMNLDEFLNK